MSRSALRWPMLDEAARADTEPLIAVRELRRHLGVYRTALR